MLIKNIGDLKKYGAPNLSIHIASMEPYIRIAEQKEVIPYIGNGIYTQLEAHYQAGTGTDVEKAMIAQLQAAIAPLALYYYTGENEVNITDMGMTRKEADGEKTAYNNQVIRTRNGLLNRGLFALEDVLTSLQTNAASWTAWTESEQYQQYNSLLVRNGRTMNKFYRNPRPQQLYAATASIMETVERLFILETFGEEFEDLKAAQTANSLTAEQAIVVDSLGKAIVYLTVGIAINELQVRLDDNGITVLSSFPDNMQDEASKRQAASGLNVSALQRQCESIGKEYMDVTRKYMDAKASATVFPKWYAAIQAAAANTTTTTDLNESITGAYSL